MHRKQWEFTYIAQALAVHGVLAPGRRGIGFGVGREPLAALFASRGCDVLATDLDTSSAQARGWVDTDQHAHDVNFLNDRGICDPGLFQSHVSFQFMDMTNLTADVGAYDFCWSACCLEHLGSIAEGFRFIESSIALLRRGGVAVHTTEFNLRSDDETLTSGPTVLFRKKDIEAFVDALRARGYQCELNLKSGNSPMNAYVDLPPYSSDKHVRLQIDRYVTTSLGIIVRA